jgi:pyruvate carboxylase subunit B
MTARSPVRFTEVALRDAHQSLLATRMRTEDMLPICDKLDQVGFWSVEAWGGATFDAALRFLREDPWDRLRRLKAAMPKTPLQMLLRGQNLLGYRHYSDDVVGAFVKRCAANGVDVFRIFDAMNDLRNLEVAVRSVLQAGKHAQGAICYTTSPVHTVEHFVEQARDLERMGCHSLCIKDMAGLITPSAASRLFHALSKAVRLPLHLHSHSTTGVAPVSLYKAVENGARHIDTAISPLAWGTSHPATESMVVAFRDTPYDSGLSLPLLQDIGFYFREVRKKYHQFESDYSGTDTRVQVNQVPGGMMSNLCNQLKELGALQRIEEVLAEIPRVREDLGYPPLVTPTSQIVGAQAVVNVLTGQRYKTVTNEVRQYLSGRYGRAPGPVNEAVRVLAIGSDEVISCRPADRIGPEMHRLRDEIGELARSEDDVLTYAMFPEVGRKFLEERAAGSLKPEALQPVAAPGRAGSGSLPRDFQMSLHGETYHVRITGTGTSTQDRESFYVTVDGVPEEVVVDSVQDAASRPSGMAPAPGRRSSEVEGTAAGPSVGAVTSSMPGTVVEVLVAPGDPVTEGDVVLVIEAMKMEYQVAAPRTGTIRAIQVRRGDSVLPQQVLAEIA